MCNHRCLCGRHRVCDCEDWEPIGTELVHSGDRCPPVVDMSEALSDMDIVDKVKSIRSKPRERRNRILYSFEGETREVIINT